MRLRLYKSKFFIKNLENKKLVVYLYSKIIKVQQTRRNIGIMVEAIEVKRFGAFYVCET